MIRPILFLGLFLLMSIMGAQSALADVTVKYKITDGADVQIVKFRDADNVRSEYWFQGKMTTAMVKNGDKLYLVNGSQVIDMTASYAAMRSMMAKMGKMGQAPSASQMKIKATGRKETVAGISGEVFKITENGRTHEAVIGQNKLLSEVGEGMGAVVNGMIGKSKSGQFLQHLGDKNTVKYPALLRFDHSFILVSVTEGKIPSSDFNVKE